MIIFTEVFWWVETIQVKSLAHGRHIIHSRHNITFDQYLGGISQSVSLVGIGNKKEKMKERLSERTV